MPLSSQHSTVLLQRFLANPKTREAFGKFAEKYQPRIKRCCLARGLQNADADDLTANILLRFCERDLFDGFVLQSKQKFYAWLRVVVARAASTFIRDRGRRPGAWGAGGDDAQLCLNQVAESMACELESVCEEDLARVAASRARVKERVAAKTWQAFCLLQDEELSTDEVARRLEMSKVSVWQARSRVLRLLRDDLSDLGARSPTGKDK